MAESSVPTQTPATEAGRDALDYLPAQAWLEPILRIEQEAAALTVERIRERLERDHALSGSGTFAIEESDMDAILDDLGDSR